MSLVIQTWLITGISGAGKTTTSAALAARFQHGAHIPGDVIQHLVVGGRVAPDPFGDEESNRPTDLCVRHQCLLARSFRSEGYAVVLDYVIGSAERLQNYLDQLPDEPIGLVVLTPSIEVARARDRERPDEDVLQAWAHMHEEMEHELAGQGLWLDTSQMSVATTVSTILSLQEEAVVN
jgi:predicted kinase